MTGGTSASDSRRPLTAAAVMITVGALLSACSDDPPTPPPPTPSATTRSPTPSATPPTAPEAKPTAASAEAFVRYFWDVYNYSYQYQDVTDLMAISRPACKFCKSAISDIQRLKAEGTRIEGAQVILNTAGIPPGKITNGVIAASVISQDEGRSIAKDGSVKSLQAVGKRRSYVGLDWEDNAWFINGVTVGKPGSA